MPSFMGVFPEPTDAAERLNRAGFACGFRQFIRPDLLASFPDANVYMGDVQLKGKRRLLIMLGAESHLAFGMELPPGQPPEILEEARKVVHELLGLPDDAQVPDLFDPAYAPLREVGTWFTAMIERWTSLDD